MGRVVRSPDSKRDTTEIWVYIAEDNFDAADRLIDLFNEKLALLADHPGLGQMRDDLAPGLRSFPVGKYLLFYRPMAGGIELVRVLHGARDLPRHFRR